MTGSAHLGRLALEGMSTKLWLSSAMIRSTPVCGRLSKAKPAWCWALWRCWPGGGTVGVGQAEIPVLLALETAKRRLGRQGSSLTNWSSSEQRGEWLPGREGLTTWNKGLGSILRTRFFLRGMVPASLVPHLKVLLGGYRVETRDHGWGLQGRLLLRSWSSDLGVGRPRWHSGQA